MKIGIYTNLVKDEGLEITKKLLSILKKNSFEYYLYSNMSEAFKGDKFFHKDNYAFLNVMITIGGDGTVLNIVKDCVKYDIPMLTINKGKKGFLNEIELSELERVVEILNGNYKVDRRRLISITVTAEADRNLLKKSPQWQTTENQKVFYALNEAYITRASTGKMVSLDAEIENHLLERYFCDGLIVSTSTGSTAYSLSAGGPVISPKAAVMCLTPVCPHTLRSRPIILNDKECVQITLGADYDDAVLMVDGIIASYISAADVVEISTSDKCIDFLRLPESNFYAKLLDKIRGLV